MKYSFKLREPNSDKPTPIYFSSFFKSEGKSLVYSTGVNIHPKDWNFEDRTTKMTALSFHTSRESTQIRKKLNKIVDTFQEIIMSYETLNETYTISEVKKELDIRLKRTVKKSNSFFGVYDEFLEAKKNQYGTEGVAPVTYNRYRYMKKHLLEFEKYKGSTLTLRGVNQRFYDDFLEFCTVEKKLSANTLHRTVGFLITFLNWAYRNRRTMNNEFESFERPKEQPTTEIALDVEQLSEIAKFPLGHVPRLEKVRDLFIIGCTTGQRFSNYKEISKSDIVGDQILVPDCKDSSKILSIPLIDITREILEKYDYNLPAISNQKFNKYIKEVFALAGFDQNTKKIQRYGKQIIEENIPLHNRISSHTARRTFITIMMEKQVPIKVIMSITGHKSVKQILNYHKLSESVRRDSMAKAFQNIKIN